MIGAIAGDIIGSVYEFGRTKSKEFPLFGPTSSYTDDSVLTVAVARAIMTGITARASWTSAGATPTRATAPSS